MKKLMWALLVCVLILTLFMFVRTPVLHTISAPKDYPTAQDDSGADVYRGALNHPTSRYYSINDYYNWKSDEGLHILQNFQTYQQSTEYTCGPAATLMVLNWFGVEDFDEMQIAALEESDTERGTSVENLARFFEDLGWDVDYNASIDTRFATIVEWESYLIEHIDAGAPILVDWEDWAGHWQVAIGVDTLGTEDPYDDVLILADPYDITDHYQDGYYIYPLGRFFDMWREGPCAQKLQPYVQPFVAARP